MIYTKSQKKKKKNLSPPALNPRPAARYRKPWRFGVRLKSVFWESCFGKVLGNLVIFRGKITKVPWNKQQIAVKKIGGIPPKIQNHVQNFPIIHFSGYFTLHVRKFKTQGTGWLSNGLHLFGCLFAALPLLQSFHQVLGRPRGRIWLHGVNGVLRSTMESYESYQQLIFQKMCCCISYTSLIYIYIAYIKTQEY